MPIRTKGHVNHQTPVFVELAAVWKLAGREARNELWEFRNDFQRHVLELALDDPHSAPCELAKSIKEPTTTVSLIIRDAIRELRVGIEARRAK